MTHPKLIYRRSDLHQAYLPIGNMLQIDSVRDVTLQGLVAELHLDGHWVFPLHFPQDPIFPGCLLIEAAGQAVAIWAWHHQLKGSPRMAKVTAEFESPVVPDDKIVEFRTVVKRKTHICFGSVEITAGDRFVARVEPVIVVVPE